MFINLYMAKMCTRFWRESLMFKLINRYRYIESMVFHEIWPERSLIDKEQKGVKQILLFQILFLRQPLINVTRYANFSMVELIRSINR